MSVPIVGQFECRAYILAKYGSHALRMFGAMHSLQPSDRGNLQSRVRNRDWS